MTETAVATTDQEHPKTDVVEVLGRKLERVSHALTIPEDFQYAIPKWTKDDRTNQWRQEIVKVGLTADAYALMNRVLGVRFFTPPQVPDADGTMQNNPILRPSRAAPPGTAANDYCRLLQGATWYSPLGQHMVSFELVEVDFWLMYQDALANAKSAELVLDKDGQLVFDERGNAKVKVNKDDNIKALKELTQLRSFGPRYAQTIAKVRLLKEASGIRSVPRKNVAKFAIPVTGFRDALDARDAVKQGSTTEALLFGLPDDVKPLTDREMLEAGGAEREDDAAVIERRERDRVAAEAEAPPTGEPPSEAPPSGEPPPDEPAGL